jgi:hypothetical protein
MFMVYVHTKFHKPRLNTLLLTTTKSKATYRFHATAVFWLYIMQINEIKYFSNNCYT